MKIESDNNVKETQSPEQLSIGALPLATLAAQPRFARLADDRAAVRAALELLRVAQTVLDHERKQADLCHAHYVAPLAPFRRQEKWPAPFEEFLKYIVPGKDLGEREQHFAEAIKWKVQRSPRIYGNDPIAAKEQLLKEFKAAKFSRATWETTALEFRRYWASRKAEAKQRAGRAGAEAKARS